MSWGFLGESIFPLCICFLWYPEEKKNQVKQTAEKNDRDGRIQTDDALATENWLKKNE